MDFCSFDVLSFLYFSGADDLALDFESIDDRRQRLRISADYLIIDSTFFDTFLFLFLGKHIMISYMDGFSTTSTPDIVIHHKKWGTISVYFLSDFSEAVVSQKAAEISDVNEIGLDVIPSSSIFQELMEFSALGFVFSRGKTLRIVLNKETVAFVDGIYQTPEGIVRSALENDQCITYYADSDGCQVYLVASFVTAENKVYIFPYCNGFPSLDPCEKQLLIFGLLQWESISGVVIPCESTSQRPFSQPFCYQAELVSPSPLSFSFFVNTSESTTQTALIKAAKSVFEQFMRDFGCLFKASKKKKNKNVWYYSSVICASISRVLCDDNEQIWNGISRTLHTSLVKKRQ